MKFHDPQLILFNRGWKEAPFLTPEDLTRYTQSCPIKHCSVLKITKGVSINFLVAWFLGLSNHEKINRTNSNSDIKKKRGGETFSEFVLTLLSAHKLITCKPELQCTKN